MEKVEKVDLIGKYVIVRSSQAGVFFGVLVEVNGTEVTLANVRKLWYWEGAAAVEQLALEGTKTPDKCKFTVSLEQVQLSEYSQISLVTDEAASNLKSVPVWKMKG